MSCIAIALVQTNGQQKTRTDQAPRKRANVCPGARPNYKSMINGQHPTYDLPIVALLSMVNYRERSL
jgi:hypothetical protein